LVLLQPVLSSSFPSSFSNSSTDGLARAVPVWPLRWHVACCHLVCPHPSARPDRPSKSRQVAATAAEHDGPARLTGLPCVALGESPSRPDALLSRGSGLRLGTGSRVTLDRSFHPAAPNNSLMLTRLAAELAGSLARQVARQSEMNCPIRRAA
jgi:hypothetical protein